RRAAGRGDAALTPLARSASVRLLFANDSGTPALRAGAAEGGGRAPPNRERDREATAESAAAASWTTRSIGAWRLRTGHLARIRRARASRRRSRRWTTT